MANLGMSNTHVNQYGSVPAKKPVTTRHRIQTAIHATFFTAAFLFVVAMVFGLVS
ncbi:hypothetical protein FHX08_005022 [Rhizobium sp. BK529]|uniref:hypothetical protein n=1 Tax=unclassified Rhizobium TaxID=2613769 RepID=UPI0010D9FCEB|nr:MULTISPECIES: hypothetical protein [unclassified Rhizobium]MBB3594618.1 hypothetical protein [Rhizobium sp. BK529]TCS02359.1 hypothetical protein EV281_105316 [Rhizobium sp. BK418]